MEKVISKGKKNIEYLRENYYHKYKKKKEDFNK